MSMADSSLQYGARLSDLKRRRSAVEQDINRLSAEREASLSVAKQLAQKLKTEFGISPSQVGPKADELHTLIEANLVKIQALLVEVERVNG